MSRKNTPIRARLTSLLAILLVSTLATTSAAQDTDSTKHMKKMTSKSAMAQIDPAVKSDIPPGSNRLILIANPELPRDVEVTTESLYDDAVASLRDSGFILDVKDKDMHHITTVPREIEEGLFVTIELNVMDGPIDEGPRIVSLAKWAPKMWADTAKWQDASWTDGKNKAAFAELVDALTDVQNSIMYTASEIAVMDKMDS
ncbi:MAG: hypothetical protein KDD65_00990 [Bacteroidetes bacterium]|nr:hypothetical protein [Bacteroidota bacterium]